MAPWSISSRYVFIYPLQIFASMFFSEFGRPPETFFHDEYGFCDCSQADLEEYVYVFLLRWWNVLQGLLSKSYLVWNHFRLFSLWFKKCHLAVCRHAFRACKLFSLTCFQFFYNFWAHLSNGPSSISAADCLLFHQKYFVWNMYALASLKLTSSASYYTYWTMLNGKQLLPRLVMFHTQH